MFQFCNILPKRKSPGIGDIFRRAMMAAILKLFIPKPNFLSPIAQRNFMKCDYLYAPLNIRGRGNQFEPESAFVCVY